MHDSGFTYGNKDNYNFAFKYYSKAASIREKIGIENVDFANTPMNAGDTYYRFMNDPCSGIPYMEKGADIYKQLGHDNYRMAMYYPGNMQNECGK